MAKAKENGSVAEVLRRWGIHSSDLVRIKKTIEQSSLEAFRERKSGLNVWSNKAKGYGVLDRFY